MLNRLQSDPFGFGGGGRFRGYVVNGAAESIDWFKGDRRTKRLDEIAALPTASLLNRDRLRFWLALLIFGLTALLGRVSYLQLVRGQYYQTVAEGNRVRIYTVKAPRGVVYDRNQTLLAKNVPSFSLAVIPVDLPTDPGPRAATIQYLAARSGLTEAAITEQINQVPSYSYQPLTVKENVNFDEATLVKIQSSQYPGVMLKTDSRRQYLQSSTTPSLSHLLGYMGKISPEKLDAYLENGYAFDDSAGKTGLELSYEAVLKGTNGKEHAEVDAFGEVKKVLAYQKPQPGQNLVLTIDLELQQQAEQSLRRIMDQYHKQRGSVIVLDPNSGEVLAMVSVPAFDSNVFISGSDSGLITSLFNDPDQPLFNRSISGEYPSGSTFKLVIAAAALQEGVITPQTGVNSVGGLSVGRWFFPDWKAGGHGWTTVTKALAESVNTFFYMVGGGYHDFAGLGVERIKTYAEKFGLNQKLGIDLPQEATGLLPSEAWKEEVKGEQWYIGDTYHLAIGQGDLLVTPLQVAAWTSVFANSGTLYQPHLVRAVGAGEDQPSVPVQSKVLNEHFIDAANLETVRQGLRQGVLTGSSRALGSLPVTVAAKTGTAEWSSTRPPHAWVTAFAPFEHPGLVVTVLIEEGEEGSRLAVPIAADVIRWWAENRLNR